MIIATASGKGGTGKTTIATSLALTWGEQTPLKFLDCDVEAPNAHFFLKPDIQRHDPFFVKVPEIDHGLCSYCGKCAEICEFNALAVLPDSVLVFEDLCHSCGGCTLLCPEGAISEKQKRIGVISQGEAGPILFLQGQLDIGQAMSPPLIQGVKDKIEHNDAVIIDAPPGTSCPMVQAVKDSDYTILVTEPTPFGLHDLRLAVGALKILKIPCGVVINRNTADYPLVRDYCREENIPVLLTIPLDKNIAVAYSEGQALIAAIPEYKEKFLELLYEIQAQLAGE
jgi:MinD superfamily P-loop ATPase